MGKQNVKILLWIDNSSTGSGDAQKGHQCPASKISITLEIKRLGGLPKTPWDGPWGKGWRNKLGGGTSLWEA